MIPSKSNFCTIYHTPAPNLPLGDDHPFLPFHFSYIFRLIFLNIFNCIISQFPVIQHTHSKFLQVGTDGPLLCQHRLPLFLSRCIQCSDESLLTHFRSSAPAVPSAYAAFLQTTLCFRTTLPVETLPLFGDMFWTYFFIHLFRFGVSPSWSPVPCILCLVCLASQLFMNTQSTFTLMMSYSHCRLGTSSILLFSSIFIRVYIFKDKWKLSFIFNAMIPHPEENNS